LQGILPLSAGPEAVTSYNNVINIYIYYINEQGNNKKATEHTEGKEDRGRQAKCLSLISVFSVA
jgi:hypothetical protein